MVLYICCEGLATVLLSNGSMQTSLPLLSFTRSLAKEYDSVLISYVDIPDSLAA